MISERSDNQTQPHPTKNDWDVEMFFDGACPLCLREARLLQKLDQQRRIRFTNIAAADFDPASVDRSQHDLMSEMHGRLPDGTWVTGVEAFRQFYSAVGFGRIARLTRLPGLRHLLDAGYRVFARYRLQLTGRCIDCCSSSNDTRSPVDMPAVSIDESAPVER